MGYSLRIGEAVLEYGRDRVSIAARAERHDGAPAFDEPTDFTNDRWPSYSSWANFCENIGIEKVMFGKKIQSDLADDLIIDEEWLMPLLSNHPGAAPITEKHLQYVEGRLELYKKENPTHFAQYPPLKKGVEPTPIPADDELVDDPRYDGNLCRGEWLIYWMRWSVENCERPVFVNS